jgi:predicted ATPase
LKGQDGFLSRARPLHIDAPAAFRRIDRIMMRIVLTGGPGAGKTYLSHRLVAEDGDRLVLVPEAATQVYTALQTRWDRLDAAGRCDVQRKIYRFQMDQEDRIAAEHPGKVLLLDRGTIDGSAYWPEGPEAYWHDVGSTREGELKRYDAVIWLQTAAAIRIYDGSDSNPCRFEDPAAAVHSGQVLRNLWCDHIQFHSVDAYVDLDEKLRAVRHIIQKYAG